MSSKLMAQLEEKRRERESREKLDQMRAEIAAAEKLKKEESLRKRREEEASRKETMLIELERKKVEKAQEELIHKTRNYFYYNEFNRKIIPPGAPYYFGDHVDYGTNVKMNPAWLPNGEGEMRIDRETIDDDGDREIIRGEVKMKGLFQKGLIHGNSYIRFSHSNEYEGEVRKGILHGTGVLTEGASVRCIEPENKLPYVERIEGVKRPAILRHNLVTCYQDELMVGKQIEIDDPHFRASYSHEKPRAVLVAHLKDWKYRVRLNDEFQPQERNIDLQGLKSFKVLHHLPLIHPLTEYNLDVDTKKPYKYDEDVYKGKVKYEIEGDRRTLNMTFNKVTPNLKTDARTTNRRENFFEPLAIGVGTAVEEEEKLRIKLAKKKQFDDMVTKMRADESAERERLLKEEMDKMLNNAKDIREKQKQESVSDDADIAEKMKREMDKV